MPDLTTITIAILLIIFTILIVGYAYLLISFNDFSVKNLDTKEFEGKKILFIYPHPDDETMASGALMNFFAQNSVVRVISVTSGQYGDELLKLPPEKLGALRKIELKNAMKDLNVDDFSVLNFIDGQTKNTKSEVKTALKNEISQFNPDLVVTYEKCGFYGHPDHVALSEVIHSLSEEMNFKVLYSTISQKLFKKLNLPTFMAEIEVKPATPQFKFNTLPYTWKKYKAAKSHKSQNLSHGKPLLAGLLVTIYEYYTYSWDK